MALDRTSFGSSGFSEGFCPPDFKDLFRDPSKEQDSKLPHGFSSGSMGDGICPLHPDHEVRRRVFAHLLKRLSEEELVGKEDFEGYLRYKYRLNFKPGSLFNL